MKSLVRFVCGFLLSSLVFACANQVEKDVWLVKSAFVKYANNENDSALSELIHFYNDSSIQITKFHHNSEYPACITKILDDRKIRMEYFKSDNGELYASYDYFYDDHSNLCLEVKMSPNYKGKLETTVQNTYVDDVLIRQLFINIDTLKEVLYSSINDSIDIIVEKSFTHKNKLVKTFINGYLVEEKTNGQIRNLYYQNDKLKREDLNPYESKFYLYDKRGRLKRVVQVIRRPNRIVRQISAVYDYYDNDSLLSVVEYHNGERYNCTTFYYSFNE